MWAYVATLLLGLAVGWQCAAMQTILSAALGPDAETMSLVAAIAFLGASVGPWLPERTILGIAGFIRRRSRREEGVVGDVTGTFWMLRALRGRDESLMWLSISILACMAGLVSLVTLGLTGPFLRLHDFLLKRFFWTNLTLAFLDWLSVAMLLGFSCVLHGLLVATLAPMAGLRTRPARQPPGMVAGIIIGLGVALILHDRWADQGLSGSQQFMAGILPMFVLAGIAARLSQQADHLVAPQLDPDAATPDVTGGVEGLVWLSLVVWGIAAALVGVGWTACSRAASQAWPPVDDLSGWCVTTVGMGTAAAWWHARRQTRSTSGCGMAAWAAGLGAGAAATLASFQPAGSAATAAQLLLLGLPLGYALHYAELAWLARVGSKTLGFAQLASAVLAGLAVGYITAHWWALPALGPVGLIAGGSLLMLAFGGIVQIYEEDRPARVRYQRLALVFASLAGAIIVFPGATKRWDLWGIRHQPLAGPTFDLDWLATSPLPPGQRVCLIGVDLFAACRWPGLGSARVDIISLAARSRSPLPRPAGPTRLLGDNPFRALALEHRQYDLIYQQARPLQPVGRFAEYSAEWLNRLAEHTLPDGQLIIDVPSIGMTADALVLIADTLEQVTASPVRWALMRKPAGTVVRLATTPPASHRRPDHGPALVWQPAAILRDSRLPRRSHSLKRDLITPGLLATPDRAGVDLLGWLTDRQSAASLPAN